MDALGTVYTELHDVCRSIDDLTNEEEDEFNNIEEVRSAVDDCTGLVKEYLERRRDDPPSTDSVVSTWVEAHKPGKFESCSDSGSSGSSDVGRVSVQEQSVRTEVSGPKFPNTPVTPRILPKIPGSNGINVNTPAGVPLRQDTLSNPNHQTENIQHSAVELSASNVKEKSVNNLEHFAEGADRFLDSAEDASLSTKHVLTASDQSFGGGARKRVGFQNNSLGTDLAFSLGTNTTLPLDERKPFVLNSNEPFFSGRDFLSETPESEFLGGGFLADDETVCLDDKRQSVDTRNFFDDTDQQYLIKNNSLGTNPTISLGVNQTCLSGNKTLLLLNINSRFL